MQDTVKIALLSDVPPDPSYTGGQVLKHIVDNTPFAKIDFFWLNQSRLRTEFTPNSQIQMVYQTTYDLGLFLTKIQNGVSKLTFGSSRIKTLFTTLLKILKALWIGRTLSKRLNASDYEYIWLVLQGENLTLSYLIIALTTRKKVIFQQWDPISWWCSHRGHGRIWSALLEKVISLIEHKAYVNLVPSFNWQQIQLSENKVSHRIDNFFCNSDLLLEPKKRVGMENEIHAVFIGQFYSNSELSNLIEKLATHAQARSKQLIVHYFGSGTPTFKAPSTTILSHGFVSRKTLIETIGQWDFALLPYPMDEKFNAASRYSFPSKSRVYLAAGLPILAYAKLDSSPHLFYLKEYASHYQNLMENPDLGDFITKACDRTDEQTQLRFRNAKGVINSHFSESVELTPFHDFLTKKTQPLKSLKGSEPELT